MIVLLSTLLAWVRGAVREALTICAWLGAGVLAWYAFVPVQGLAKETIETPWLADTAALVVVFVVPLIVLKVLAAVLPEQLPRGWFGHLDRSLGALFGLFRGALIVVAAWLGTSLVVEPERLPAAVTEARTMPYVEEGARWLERLLPEPAGAEDGVAQARTGGESA